MDFHLGLRIILLRGGIILSIVGIYFMTIGCAKTDMKQLNNNRFMGFYEENSFLRNWVIENLEIPRAFEPIWGKGVVEVEEELLPILDDLEFYALYIESSPNDSIWDVFLIGHDGTDWIQSCWKKGQKIVLEKPVLKDDWNEQICNFRFSDDIVVDSGKYILLDAPSAFLFITCQDRLKRLAVNYPNYSGIDMESDDRYILKIQRMIKNIKRNYRRIQRAKKGGT